MTQYQWNKRCVFSFLLSGAVVVVIMLCDCRKNADEEFVFNLAAASLTEIAEKHEGSDLGEQAKEALSRLRNGVRDTEPMLMRALIDFTVPNEPGLTILCFDEDRDVRGLRIREQHVDPSGNTTILDEDYPVFVNRLKSLIWEPPWFPIQVRDKQQRKDECLWLQYANRCLDEIIRLYVDEQRQGNGAIVDVELLDVEMPPIYLSLPEPDSVRVFVSVYDRAGHESQRIELLKPPFVP